MFIADVKHQRFHVTVGKFRTTVSLDSWLAALLAARLRVDPLSKDAHGAVRTWLQKKIVATDTVASINRRLFRLALLEISDKTLSDRCLSLFGSAQVTPLKGPGGRTPPGLLSLVAALGQHSHGCFVLYQYLGAHLQPAVVGLSKSVDELLSYFDDMNEDASFAFKMNKPSYHIADEPETEQGYFIRRCSEVCWDALKKKRVNRIRLIHGVFVTHKEYVLFRRETLWSRNLNSLKHRQNLNK